VSDLSKFDFPTFGSDFPENHVASRECLEISAESLDRRHSRCSFRQFFAERATIGRIRKTRGERRDRGKIARCARGGERGAYSTGCRVLICIRRACLRVPRGTRRDAATRRRQDETTTAPCFGFCASTGGQGSADDADARSWREFAWLCHHSLRNDRVASETKSMTRSMKSKTDLEPR
jgi:hypothetical protein